MLFIVGRWGAGTSLVAEIVRRHGYYFGNGDWGHDRCPHGVLEDKRTLNAFIQGRTGKIKAALKQLNADARQRDLRPALKMPWILYRNRFWYFLHEHATCAVLVRRPSKPEASFTMEQRYQALMPLRYKQLRSCWTRLHVPLRELFFEDLILRPEPTLTSLAQFLGVVPDLSSLDAIDRNWPQSKVMDIPKDKTYHADSLQCDGCGGHGCERCGDKGWVPPGNPNARRCANPNCGNFLRPTVVPVYCSNKCAFDDA